MNQNPERISRSLKLTSLIFVLYTISIYCVCYFYTVRRPPPLISPSELHRTLNLISGRRRVQFVGRANGKWNSDQSDRANKENEPELPRTLSPWRRVRGDNGCAGTEARRVPRGIGQEIMGTPEPATNPGINSRRHGFPEKFVLAPRTGITAIE